MELLLLDENFEICGLIDDWESLIWNRKYYECGNFKLQISSKYLSQFENAKYVYCKDEREIGVFETFEFSDKTDKKSLKFSGRFLESVLSKRVIDTTQNFSNKTTEVICRSLVDTIAISSGERAIENLELGELQGLGEKRTVQITGSNLLDSLYELCEEDELSIQVNYDFDNQKLIFILWQGLDRTDSQTENTWAIFSKNFENITDDEYSKDETQYCNFAYVAGEVPEDESESTRTIITVDRIKDGEERRELYVDARDLQSDDDTTQEEYEEMLKERGIEKLNENTEVETAEFTIDTLSNLEYKKDFDLGDKVTYKNTTLGIIVENRIIEISECYENGRKTIDIVFGEDYNVKKIKEAI